MSLSRQREITRRDDPGVVGRSDAIRRMGLDAERQKEDVAIMTNRFLAIRGFTLVELLVVISIIGLLAGLSIPAVGGAMNSAKKAKVSAFAHQVRTALVQFNTEYGYFPTNGMNQGVGTTASTLALILTGSASSTNDNPRRVSFLEVPSDFTLNGLGNISNSGIVTPRGFYAGGQSNLSVSVDHDYDGQISVTNGTTKINLTATTAVWFVDPRNSGKTIGTWK
jgi:prepilin-type N-terminal cleavage/methylation domain-containing protein